MRYCEATSMIAASPEAVWAVLTNEASWPSRPSWDWGVDAVEGRIAMSFQRLAGGLKQQVESGV